GRWRTFSLQPGICPQLDRVPAELGPGRQSTAAGERRYYSRYAFDSGRGSDQCPRERDVGVTTVSGTVASWQVSVLCDRQLRTGKRGLPFEFMYQEEGHGYYHHRRSVRFHAGGVHRL